MRPYLTLVGFAIALVSTTAGNAQAADSRVILEGVDRYRVREPVAEGVRVILSYRGEKYSPAYVQGISGAAFRIAGPCPCAPTCWGTRPPAELARLFGYEAEQIDIGAPYRDSDAASGASDAERQTRMRNALARIKDEIRAKRPVLLVQAFTTWEYDVVCGFDEERRELYGRGSYEGLEEYAYADDMRALGATEIGGGPYAVLIGEKTGHFDANAAELAALREAVVHAHAQSGKLPQGLECYDLWISSYRRRGSFMAPKGLPHDGYPLGILASTRQAASQFMLELATKYPQVTANLEMASDCFAREARALASAKELRATMEDEPSEEQRVRMAGLLSQARAMYALAIDEVGRTLRKIGGPRSDETE